MLKEFPSERIKKFELPDEPETSHLGYMSTASVIKLLASLADYMSQDPDDSKVNNGSTAAYINKLIDKLGEERTTSLAIARSDGTMWTPVDALTSALKDTEAEDKKTAFSSCKKMVILALDDNDDNYSVSFIQAGMRLSECISLCRAAENVFLKQMDFI